LECTFSQRLKVQLTHAFRESTVKANHISPIFDRSA
jgi:hypothetical protein